MVHFGSQSIQRPDYSLCNYFYLYEYMWVSERIKESCAIREASAEDPLRKLEERSAIAAEILERGAKAEAPAEQKGAFWRWCDNSAQFYLVQPNEGKMLTLCAMVHVNAWCLLLTLWWLRFVLWCVSVLVAIVRCCTVLSCCPKCEKEPFAT